MTRNILAKRDVALLGRLSHGPCELGDLPVDGIERLTALGLATRVLGFCEITGAGQLTYHRHQHSIGPRAQLAHAAQIDPHVPKDSSFRASAQRNKPRTVMTVRHGNDARLAREAPLPEWIRRFVTETAHLVCGKSE